MLGFKATYGKLFASEGLDGDTAANGSEQVPETVDSHWFGSAYRRRIVKLQIVAILMLVAANSLYIRSKRNTRRRARLNESCS